MSISIDPADPSSSRARPLSVRELIRRAEELAALGKWAAAEVLYRRAVAVDPSPASLIAFAVFLADTDRCGEAITALERAWDDACRIACAPVRAICCGNLAILHRRMGNLALSKQFRQLSLAAEMESPEFQSGATFTSTQFRESAAQLSVEGDHEEAIKLLSAAQSRSDRDLPMASASSDGAWGVLLARLGLIETALRVLFRSSRRHFHDNRPLLRAHDLCNLGHLLQGNRRFADAAWCFRVASGLYSQAGAGERSEESRRFCREARRRAAHDAVDPCCN